MPIALLEEYNKAMSDYTSCKKLAKEHGPFTLTRDDTISGKLVTRITNVVGYKTHPGVEFLIWTTSLDVLIKSELKEHVREVCNLLR